MPPPKKRDGNDEGEPLSGMEAVGYALSDLLAKPEVSKGIGEWISAHAKSIRISLEFRSYPCGSVFYSA